MVTGARHLLDNPPEGRLTVVSVIAGMSGPQRAEMATRCSARMRARSGEYGYQEAYDRSWFLLEYDGWHDGEIPVGVTEAVLLVEVVAKLATARRKPASSREDNPLDPAWVAEDAAYASERAWAWSTLAELEGFDGMDGTVIGAMAEQWALDFRSLLEAVRAATA